MNKEDNAFLSELENNLAIRNQQEEALAQQQVLDNYRNYVDSVNNLNMLRASLGMEISNKGYSQAKRGRCIPKAALGDDVEAMIRYAKAQNYDYSTPQDEQVQQAVQTPQEEVGDTGLKILYQPKKYSLGPLAGTRFTDRTTRRLVKARGERFDDFYRSVKDQYDPDFYEVAKNNYMATGRDANIEKRMNDDGTGLYKAIRQERRGWSPATAMFYTGLAEDTTATPTQTPAEEAPQNTPEQSQETPETPAQDTGLSPEVITSTETTTPASSAAANKPVSKGSGNKSTKVGGQNGNKGKGTFTGTKIPGSTAAGTAPTSPGTVNNPISWYDNVKGGYTDEYYANYNGATGKPRPGYTGSVYKDYDPSQSEAYYNGVKYGTPVIEMARYYGTTPDVMQQYITSGEKYYNPRDWSSINRYLKQNPTTQVIYYDDPSWIGGFDRGFYQPKLNSNGNYSIGQRIGYTYKRQYGGTADVSSLVSQYNELDENQKNEFLSKLGLI